MTKAQQAKNRMIEYFENVDLPKEPVIIDGGTIFDIKKYVETNKKRLDVFVENGIAWRSAYFLLYKLKKSIDG